LGGSLSILHVSDNSYPSIGGVERVIHEIAKRQVVAGNRVAVVSQWHNFRAMRPGSFCFEGVRYVKLPRLLFPYLAFLYASKYKPDVVHLNSYLSSRLFSGGELKRRVVRHVHDVYTSLYQSYFGLRVEHIASALERRWTECFEYYIVPSYSTKLRLERIVGGRKKVWIVPNGVDTSVFRPRHEFSIKNRLGLKEPSRLVGFVGRVAFGKGAFDTYLAARPILRKYKDVYLVYVGPGDTLKTSGQKSALNRILKQAWLDGLSSKVFYVPPLGDVELASAYTCFEVLMLPSMSEGFGLSVLEAAACGTPSIVYDSGSLPEIVDDGKTGIVVRRGDVEGLRSALEAILENSDMRRDLSRRCIIKAKEYDWSAIVSRIEGVYHEIIDGTA